MKTKLLLGVIALLVCFSFPSAGATRTLTVNASGNGTVTRNPTNSAYPNGVVVTLTAVPGSNWVFSSWSGDLSGTANPVNVIMDSDKVINATFTEIPTYQLTVLTTGAGSVSPSSGTYVSNSSVVMAATPSSGWVFTGWSGDLTGTANPANLTMSGPKTVTATFGQLPAITAQPQSTSVSVGSTANFNVTAIGGSLQYEWHFVGAVLTGADQPSLTITNVQSAHAGDYYVVVRNSYGVTTSQVATLTVDCAGTNVVNVCTDAALRQAVEIGGTVRICCNGTITLTNQIEVTKDTVIDATGQNVVISGNHQVRLFRVSTNISFLVSNAVLAGGRYTGPVTYFGPGADGCGAAIQNLGGNVHLYSCVLSNNVASGGPKSVFEHIEGNGYGGAVSCQGGSLTLNNVLLVSNTVTMLGADSTATNAAASGGAIYLENATGTFLNSAMFGNTSITPSGSVPKTARGGMLYQRSGSSLFSNCVVSANKSISGNIASSVFTRPAAGEGGALFIAGGECRIYNSSIQDNSANGGNAGNTGVWSGDGRGGGIYNTAELTLHSSVLSSNRAGSGTGGMAGPAFGGGLYTLGTSVVLNTTFAYNSAGERSSAGPAYGGNIFNLGRLTAVHCTVANNPVPSRTIGVNIANTNGIVSLRSSLLAASGTSDNSWGPLVDDGYNISSDGSANFYSGSSFNFTDPKLLPLANNGGPTLTMALAEDSPAIDWAPAASAPATDQRGVARPYGAGADVGAFEAGPPLPRVDASSADSTLRISFNARAGMTYRIERSTDLISWQSVETISTGGIVIREFLRASTKEFYRVSCSW